MTFRYRNKNKALKKSMGLVSVVLGLAIIIYYMPVWMWPMIAGIGLIGLGCVLFYNAK
ncbi:hypothetical protein [Desulfuribacillus stibiiarsenatis]|uniref:hypothetical protein n=1 Tax=Desulfuribacillus stibiiarsenatis TaxID=1390249 RepID=UPI00159F09CF|nr:hypothetical protein [Desulfuribacillus stibiiarsenatis]